MTCWLDSLTVLRSAQACVRAEVPDAVRINRIARLERLKAATAALQAAESVRFAQSQAEAQLAADGSICRKPIGC